MLGIAAGRLAADVAQETSFGGRAFNDSLCQNLPLGRRETAWQQCAPLPVFRVGLAERSLCGAQQTNLYDRRAKLAAAGLDHVAI